VRAALLRRAVASVGAAALAVAALAPVGRAAGSPPPTRAAVSPAAFAPGATLTLTGSGFGSEVDGDAVAFVGAAVPAPAAYGRVIAWGNTSITVQAPEAGLWPGSAAVELTSPQWDAATATRPVTVLAPGTALTAPQADWLPGSGAGGGLSVGWFDAAGAPTGRLTLTLPTAIPGGSPGFTVPAQLPTGSVLLDGTPVAAQVGEGTVAWPDGTSTAAAVLTLDAAAAPVGEVTVAVAPSAGLTVPPGSYPLGIAADGATAVVPLQVSADGVTGYRLSAPAGIASGVPFPVTIEAVDAQGDTVAGDDATVFLSSVGGAVDFPDAAPALAGPASVQVALTGGTAVATAVAGVAGAVTLRVSDGAGLSGSLGVQVAAPPVGTGMTVQVFPAFSGWSGATTLYAAADVDAGGPLTGILAPAASASSATAYGGWWPLGAGLGYEAQWSGVLTVTAPPALPAPLPQPTLQFAFLNLAAESGSAMLAPVAGSGASADGGTVPLGLATGTQGGGPVQPTLVTLTPGRYRLTVQSAEDSPRGAGAGDTLEYSEALLAPGASAAQWTPLAPVPPAAFGPQGLPAPALEVGIGAGSADDAGATIALPAPAVISGSSTLLPLRALAQALGAQVSWDAQTGGIAVDGPAGPVTLTVGSTEATVAGQPVTLQAAATVVPPGVTLVPLRFIGQALGWQVAWDAAARQAVLLPPLSSAVPS